ncbi:hypothetical protein RclHR1_02420011 [Rhizophagus clarus]|nr:hypothetical protein RclHR1_02420011 [Rhizophagus clarus]
MTSKLSIDEIIIGVQFSKNEILSTSEDKFFLGNIPYDLIEAWVTQFDKIENADVRFDVQDASSTILSARSEYFQNSFKEDW